MSFCDDPSVFWNCGVNPAGFDGGAVFSGIARAPTPTVAPATTAPLMTAGDGPWPQIWPLLQKGAVCGNCGPLFPPPASTATTRQVLATPEAGAGRGKAAVRAPGGVNPVARVRAGDLAGHPD